jgi:hypothetical protein
MSQDSSFTPSQDPVLPCTSSSLSVTLSPSQKRRNISHIWDFFTKKDSKLYCKVDNCSVSYSSSTGNSTLAKHLTKMHNIDSIREIEAIDESSSDSLPTKKFSSFRLSTSEQNQKNELLLNLIIEESLPFSFSNSQAFKAFVRSFDPRYVLPESKTVKDLIKARFEREYQVIKNTLKDNRSMVNITMDIWTSVAKDPFMCFTCHFIDSEWKLQSLLLKIPYFPHPHESPNINELLVEVGFL